MQAVMVDTAMIVLARGLIWMLLKGSVYAM